MNTQKADINDYIYTGLFVAGWFTVIILIMKSF